VTSSPVTVLDPAMAVRSTIDARILLGLWCARKAFVPLLLTGFIVAAAWFMVVDHDAVTFVDRMNQLGTPAEVASAALSPFALVAGALAMRITIALAALVAATPLAFRNRASDYPHAGWLGRHMRVWWDRWKLSQSLRAFRWTWLVHGVVLDRLDARGSIWDHWDRIVVILNVVLTIAFFVVVTIALAQVPVEAGP
jgi:hypothetical protein